VTTYVSVRNRTQDFPFALLSKFEGMKSSVILFCNYMRKYYFIHTALV